MDAERIILSRSPQEFTDWQEMNGNDEYKPTVIFVPSSQATSPESPIPIEGVEKSEKRNSSKFVTKTLKALAKPLSRRNVGDGFEKSAKTHSGGFLSRLVKLLSILVRRRKRDLVSTDKEKPATDQPRSQTAAPAPVAASPGGTAPLQEEEEYYDDFVVGSPSQDGRGGTDHIECTMCLAPLLLDLQEEVRCRISFAKKQQQQSVNSVNSGLR